MYVYIHVCVYTHIYAQTIYLFIDIDPIHSFITVNIFECIEYIYTYIYVYIHTYIYIYIYTFIYIYIYINVYIYIYIYIDIDSMHSFMDCIYTYV